MRHCCDLNFLRKLHFLIEYALTDNYSTVILCSECGKAFAARKRYVLIGKIALLLFSLTSWKSFVSQLCNCAIADLKMQMGAGIKTKKTFIMNYLWKDIATCANAWNPWRKKYLIDRKNEPDFTDVLAFYVKV